MDAALTENGMPTPCYVLSLKHLQRDHPFMTVWRPDDNGYAWPLAWAGKYDEAAIKKDLDYYNDGHAAVAVPCHVLDAMAVVPEPGWIDNDIGPVVLSNADNWATILANVIAPPKYLPQPQYRGAPRKRKVRVNLHSADTHLRYDAGRA